MTAEPPLPVEDLDHVLEGVGGIWPDLRGSQVFITGGTGFFGRWMIESLLAANRRFGLGARATVLTRDPARFKNQVPHWAAAPELEWITGSVTTLTADAWQGRQFDAVIHLATEGDMRVTQNKPAAAFEVIVDGARRVLDLATQTGARRFLFTSSGAVYGAQPPAMERMAETFGGMADSRGAISPYAIGGEAKRQAESLCQAAYVPQKLEPTIARCFTFAGPAQPLDGKFAFGNFLRDALAGRLIVLEGDGTPVRSDLHAADLSIWLWTILMRGTAGRVYNVGSENALDLRTLAKLIASELGSPGIKIMQAPKSHAPVSRYVPDTQRARAELGLRETIELAATIQRTAAWHRLR
jgi:nucleoside-diphosphate-sugar epimerase